MKALNDWTMALATHPNCRIGFHIAGCEILLPLPSILSFRIRSNLAAVATRFMVNSLENRRLLSNLPDHDQVLANAIDKSKVVLGFTLKPDGSNQREPEIKARYVEIGKSPEPNLPQFSGILTSLPMLESVAEGNGALTFISDADGIVRKLTPSV